MLPPNPPALVQRVESICVEGEELKFSDELRSEYDSLFESSVIDPKRSEQIEHAIDQIERGKPRYIAVGTPLGVPWYVVGILHWRECSGDFSCHLHNGDPLRHRTVNVPSGRPPYGQPPFTWEQSARDALVYEGFDAWRDWSISGTCFVFEKYNGFGYRAHGIHSPYLWAGTNQYASGKFISDGQWSPGAVDKQVGAAALMKRMLEQDLAVAFAASSIAH